MFSIFIDIVPSRTIHETTDLSRGLFVKILSQPHVMRQKMPDRYFRQGHEVTGSDYTEGPMAATRDPDLLLIERMLAPPPLEDARSSHDYWRRRRKTLPLYRLTARREAKQMTVFWEERVRAAEQAKFEASPVGRVLAALGLSGHWLRRAQLAKRVTVWLIWGLIFRRLRLIAGSIAAAGVLLVLGVVALVVLAIAQFV